MEEKSEQHGFSLKVDPAFASKRDSIFGSLDVLEKKHDAHEKVYQETHKEEAGKMLKSDPVFDDCVDSSKQQNPIFRRPSFPEKRGHHGNRGRGIPRRNYTPAFKSQPEKWKKYSLSDVSADDMSDQTNAATAFSFLRQLEEEKRGANKDVKTEETGGKIVFNKPKHSEKEKKKDVKYTPKISDDSVLGCSGSKLTMPEYQFGEKQSKLKRKKDKNKSVSAADKVALGFDYVDEEEGEEESEDFEIVAEKKKNPSSFKFTPKRKREEEDGDG